MAGGNLPRSASGLRSQHTCSFGTAPAVVAATEAARLLLRIIFRMNTCLKEKAIAGIAMCSGLGGGRCRHCRRQR